MQSHPVSHQHNLSGCFEWKAVQKAQDWLYRELENAICIQFPLLWRVFLIFFLSSWTFYRTSPLIQWSKLHILFPLLKSYLLMKLLNKNTKSGSKSHLACLAVWNSCENSLLIIINIQNQLKRALFMWSRSEAYLYLNSLNKAAFLWPCPSLQLHISSEPCSKPWVKHEASHLYCNGRSTLPISIIHSCTFLLSSGIWHQSIYAGCGIRERSGGRSLFAWYGARHAT